MFKKPTEDEERLEQPLLEEQDRNLDDDIREGHDLGPPTVSNVGILGIGPARTKGYARVVDEYDEQRAEEDARERADRMNTIALQRQRNNQASFEQDMVELENKVIREAKEKARLEENDRLLALRLQQELGGAQSAPAVMPPTTTMMVIVPEGTFGGQMVAVMVPGKGTINIMVPHGLRPGDQFNFKIPTQPSVSPSASSSQTRIATVTIPRGVGPGGTFRIILPTNRVVVVGIPAGVREGELIRVPYDDNTGVPNPLPAPQTATINDDRYNASANDESIAVMESLEEVAETAEQRAEREAFLSALPEDVRREVLAQETAQKRRLSTFRNPPVEQDSARSLNEAEPLTAEQIEFLQTLPEDLREDVERDLRVQNALERQRGGGSSPQGPPQQPVPPPLATVPVASVSSSQQDDADLLGLGFASSSPPAQTPAPASPTRNQPPIDMFQNLSVMGVNKDTKSSNSQEI